MLERLLGKPRGSGVGLTFFKHFHFQLLSGTFDGDRIRGAQMAWADRAAGGIPTPDRTGNYLDFDIELSATQLRLPFHGEFVLPDSSPAPAKLVVSPAAPIWVELRPGPEIAVGGRARASFANGPELDLDFHFDDPVFRAALGARHFRLPETLPLTRFLPVLPPALGSPAPASLAGLLPNLEPRLAELTRAQCAGSSVALRLLGDGSTDTGFAKPPGLDASDSDLAARDFTQEALAELKAWTCFVEAAGGYEQVRFVDATLRELLQRFVNSSVEDTSPIIPRGDDVGPMTFAYRTTILGEVATMAVAGFPEQPNEALQPFVDQAYEAVRVLADADASAWDPTTLIVAARGIARALAVGERNANILNPERTQSLTRTFEALIRARAAALQRDLQVSRGVQLPDGNPAIENLHRWEALARLRQALQVNSLAQFAGLPSEGGDPVPPEVMGQLAHHAWRQLERIIQQATNSCTPLGYHTVLATSPEIARIAVIGDQLRVLGFTNELPVPSDAVRYAIEAEQHCANSGVATNIVDLLRKDPENLTARAEAHLVLLEGVPRTVTALNPEIAMGISAAGESLKEILRADRAIRLTSFSPDQLIRVLRIALRHDELRRRFNLVSEPNWLGQQLPELTRRLRSGRNLGSRGQRRRPQPAVGAR